MKNLGKISIFLGILVLFGASHVFADAPVISTCVNPYAKNVYQTVGPCPVVTPSVITQPTPTPTPYYYNQQPQYYYQQPQNYAQPQPNYNYVQQTYPSSINVACATSPASPKIGDTVTFAAAASGPSNYPGPYTWEWSGSVSGTSQSVNTSFSTSGTKSAVIIAKDVYGDTAQSSCSAIIGSAGASPTPTPTPKPTATPKPTPTAGKVEGATTVCKQVTVCFDQTTGKVTETPPAPSGVGTPASDVGASSPSSVSKNNSKSASLSLFASIFNIKGDAGGKIKSLVIWYAVILLVILFIVLSYMGIKSMKNKKAAAEELDQQKRIE